VEVRAEDGAMWRGTLAVVNNAEVCVHLVGSSLSFSHVSFTQLQLRDSNDVISRFPVPQCRAGRFIVTQQRSLLADEELKK